MCNFCMLVLTTPIWGGSLQKNTLTLEKKERPALEGDTFNGCPYPPLQQPCSSFYLFRSLNYPTNCLASPFISNHVSQHLSTEPL